MDFTGDFVVIPGFPIPPPDNRLKMPVRRFKKGGGGRVLTFADSAEYAGFKRDVQIWFMQYNRTFHKELVQIQNWVLAGHILQIHCDVRVYHERIYTKEGKIKRWDVTNLMKAVHDSFTEICGIDDSVFFDCSQSKVEIEKNRRECIYIAVGPVSPKKDSK